MSTVCYRSGTEIKQGDSIRYHGEPGAVEFVVTQPSDDPARNWFVQQFPGGGIMIQAKGFGSVFLGLNDIDEQLEFVNRSGSLK